MGGDAMTNRGVLSEWADGTVDPDELLDQVAAYFESGRQESDGWIRYPSDGPLAMRASAPPDGTVRFERGPALTPMMLDELHSRVESKLAATTGPTRLTRVMFTSRRVEGYYEAPSGAFRIGPVPPTAPRPEQILADHPFVFEASVPGSADATATGYRVSRAAQRWAWILNALLIQGIRLPGNVVQHHWSLCGPPAPPFGEARIQYAQEMYWFEGLGDPSYALPEGGPAIASIDATEYYGRLGLDSSPFDLPSTIDGSIAAYLALNSTDRRRFLQAAQWFSAAGNVALVHRSSMFVALVAAIETLAFAPFPGKPCPNCGHDTSPGPTGRFKDFLARMAPGFPRGAADRLYDVRSSLVHGIETLLQDEPLATTFKSSLLAEQQQTRMLYSLVRAALVNWLSRAATGA